MAGTEVKRAVVPPDGGWGWFVVLGVSLCNFSTRSIEPSFGLLFGDLLKELNIETTGAAIIMSIMEATINFSGIFVGPLIKIYSYRKVALLGSVLCFTGLILTSAAGSMTHIIITYSIIRGFGAGLAWSSCLVCLNNFFLKKRGQAVGLAMAGTAVGFMLMPQAVQFFLKIYGFSGSILVLSGICLHAVVGALLLQPITWHIKQTPESINLTHQDKDENGLSEIWTDKGNGIELLQVANPIVNGDYSASNKTTISKNPSRLKLGSSTTLCQRRLSATHSTYCAGEEGELLVIKNLSKTEPPNIVPSTEQNSRIQAKKKKTKLSFWRRFFVFMDFDLLKDPIYLNIVFGISIFFVAEVNFKMVLPFFMADMGYTKSETAFCLSIMAISDLIARLILPPICDKFDVSRRMLFLVSAFLLGISRSILAEQTSYVALLITISVSGLFRGSTLINFSLSISEYCSLDKLPAAIGLQMVIRGFFIIALGPVVGVIRDVSGSYPICIHFQTFLIAICCLAWGIEFAFVRWRKKKDIEGMDE